MFCALILAATWLTPSLAADVDSKPVDGKHVDSKQRLAEFEADIHPVLKRLCFECHGSGVQKSDLRVDTLDADMVLGSDRETWHDVLNRINLGEMPPADSEQPTAQERRLLVRWLTTSLRAAAAAQRYAAGRVVTRRLTRYEYQNTMRDLLGVQMDYAKDLPPEPASPAGFLNNGAVNEMSPLHMETYLRAARRGLAEAIVEGDKPQVYRYQAEKTAVGKLPGRKVAGHEPVQPEFLLDIKEFPRAGEFRIRIQAGATMAAGAGYPRLRLSLGCVPGIIHVPRKVVGEVDVTAPVDEPQTFVFRGRLEDFPQPGEREFGNVDFNGMVALIDFLDADGNQLRYPDRAYVEPPKKKPKKKQDQKKKAKQKPSKKKQQQQEQAGADGRALAIGEPPEPAKKARPARNDIIIQSVEFEAPVYASWPPQSHARILFPSAASGDEPSYVREVLRRFMNRAFRREVSRGEVEKTFELFQAIRASTASPEENTSPESTSQEKRVSLEEALRETLSSVLVSPHFLYIVETRSEQSQGEQISDMELATRLSYFLWSSMPDEKLFEVARSGKLQDAATLEREVLRMLDDPRSEALLGRLADQWFDLDGLDRVAVNPEHFPNFAERLKEDMRGETRAFFREIVRSDLSCLNLLDSDWTMLNRPLAQHYGVQGPRGTKFERVQFAEGDPRGGLLGQGAFLLSNSNGESSHPIKRAVWILDRLLAAPPAPPPPDVPELDAESPDLAGLSLKQQLAIHRQKEACANCHRGIDPWGVPLEGFDAVGNWRGSRSPAKTQAQAAETAQVDASSELPDGTKIDGAAQLKQYLLERRREQFARSVVKRVATYALGRSLDSGDQAGIDRLTEQFIAGDYRFKQLVVDLAGSELFQTK